MANIDINNISDLDVDGNSLFEDSESFMTELSNDEELKSIAGGECNAISCLFFSCWDTNPDPVDKIA